MARGPGVWGIRACRAMQGMEELCRSRAASASGLVPACADHSQDKAVRATAQMYKAS